MIEENVSLNFDNKSLIALVKKYIEEKFPEHGEHAINISTSGSMNHEVNVHVMIYRNART